MQLKGKFEVDLGLGVSEAVLRPLPLEKEPLAEFQKQVIRPILQLRTDRVVSLVRCTTVRPIQTELEVEGILGIGSAPILDLVEGHPGQPQNRVQVEKAERSILWKDHDDRAQIPWELREAGPFFIRGWLLVRGRGGTVQKTQEGQECPSESRLRT